MKCSHCAKQLRDEIAYVVHHHAFDCENRPELGTRREKAAARKRMRRLRNARASA